MQSRAENPAILYVLIKPSLDVTYKCRRSGPASWLAPVLWLFAGLDKSEEEWKEWNKVLSC